MEEYKHSDDSLAHRYLWGAGPGELVSLYTGSNGQTYYLYQDGRNNTSQIADASAMVQEKYKYDLNGTPTVYDPSDNVMPNGSAIGNRFLFGGQDYYQELGLINLRNRFYLPALGRFLQPDPIGFAGDPSNLYRYCGNNPANGSDPMGLEPGFGTAFGFVAGGVGGAYQTYLQTHSIGLSAVSFVVGGVAGAFAGSLFEGFAPGVGAWAGSFVADFGEGAVSSYVGQVMGNVLSNPSQLGPDDLANFNPGLIIGAGLGNAVVVPLRGSLPSKLVASAAFRGAWAAAEGVISGTTEMGGGQLWNWIFTDTDPDGTAWQEDLGGSFDSHGVFTINGLAGVGVDPNSNGGSSASGNGGGGGFGSGGSAGAAGGVSPPAA